VAKIGFSTKLKLKYFELAFPIKYKLKKITIDRKKIIIHSNHIQTLEFFFFYIFN
tara:strand:- start:654 stop:818 length:165 start_codon:yes stop_codon:yes gene_type:complete